MKGGIGKPPSRRLSRMLAQIVRRSNTPEDVFYAHDEHPINARVLLCHATLPLFPHAAEAECESPGAVNSTTMPGFSDDHSLF